jgi:hypothetical protein
MTLRELTFEEKQKQEEENLLLYLDNMNKSFKNKNKKEFVSAVTDLFISNIGKENDGFINQIQGQSNCQCHAQKSLKSKRSHSFDNLEGIEYDFNYKVRKSLRNPSKKQALDPSNEDKQSMESSISTNFTFNSMNSSNSKIENLILQNLSMTDETIKLIIIGDKGVGKTILTKKLCSDDIGNLKKYNPTQSLEIKRFVFNTLNKIIRVELWDTNLSILNSPIIKTYFKICNGFILACDISNIDSIKFLENQIDNIINMSTFTNDNIIVYANIKNEVDPEEFHYNLNYLNTFQDKFGIKVNFMNFTEMDVGKDFKFQKYVNSCIIRKTGRMKLGSNNNKKLHSTGQKMLKEPSEINNVESKLIKGENDIYSRDMSSSPRTKKEKCIIY